MDRENALDRARKEINEADAEIARLFEKRMNAVRSVALYKKERGLPVTDEAREQAVIERGAALIQTPEYRPYYVNFQKSCMEVSKSFQHRLLDGARVAYGGAEGAFADTVARRVFPDAVTVAYPDFARAYSAVEEGECDYALLPLENSLRQVERIRSGSDGKGGKDFRHNGQITRAVFLKKSCTKSACIKSALVCPII